MQNNELKKQELENITGGTSRERTIIVVIDYSKCKQFTSDVEVKPYLDGELLIDKVITVDCSITSVNISLTGKGKAQLKVKLNNELFKIYDLDFDNSIINVIS